MLRSVGAFLERSGLALVERLMAEPAGEVPGAPTEVGTDALDRLRSYAWPGNVREMHNALERGMIMARDAPALGLEHPPADLTLRKKIRDYGLKA